jgi:hypothetical protein
MNTPAANRRLRYGSPLAPILDEVEVTYQEKLAAQRADADVVGFGKFKRRKPAKRRKSGNRPRT